MLIYFLFPIYFFCISELFVSSRARTRSRLSTPLPASVQTSLLLTWLWGAEPLSVLLRLRESGTAGGSSKYRVDLGGQHVFAHQKCGFEGVTVRRTETVTLGISRKDLLMLFNHNLI